MLQLDITPEQARAAATVLRREAMRLERPSTSDGLDQDVYTPDEVVKLWRRITDLCYVAEQLHSPKEDPTA